MSPKPRLSLLIFLSVLIPWISGILAQSPSSPDPYSTCGDLFTCGEIVRIGYPFWGGNRTSVCGYPELELKCESNVTKITLSRVSYRVLGIYPEMRVMKLVREDYSSGSPCSPALFNSTFDPAVLGNVNGYMNLTFLYGCPTMATTTPTFSCNNTGFPSPGVYTLPGAFGPGGCFASVYFPVPLGLLALNTSQSDFRSQLPQGFEVGLSMDFATCTSCNQSKGVCGYDQATRRTTCHCSDGSTSATGTCPLGAAAGPLGQTSSKGTLT
ncbi:hypothetical protein MLD38_040694 [Melastoma candidum]|nr:hypothetical protein MLD38_040694 [Melastoma candidum]